MKSSATVPDYSRCASSPLDHALAFLVGFTAGFLVLFIFYKILMLSITGGAVFGLISVFLAARTAVKKRKLKLRIQFFDLLEAMSVAIRAGNPLLKSLQSARDDLVLIYPADCDIILEVDVIIGKFNNAVPICSEMP